MSRKSVVRLTDRPDMTLDVYRGRKTTKQQTNLQAVAVSITLHRVITLCSIYIPPSSRLSAKDLDDLVPQLASPFILLGDFDGHNILWGSKDINDKGRIIENFIDNHGLCLYNTKNSHVFTPSHWHIYFFRPFYMLPYSSLGL